MSNLKYDPRGLVVDERSQSATYLCRYMYNKDTTASNGTGDGANNGFGASNGDSSAETTVDSYSSGGNNFGN